MTTDRHAGAVVMAVYRPDGVLLERQIASLKAQTVSGWTCVVGVDGPDDEANRLLAGLVAGDPRFQVHRFDDNVGVYRHFERLLERVPASASWVSLSDQDDFWYPEKFARLLPMLDDTDVMAVTGQARVVRSSGTVLGHTDRRPGDLVETLLRNQLTGSLAILRRDLLESALPFPAAVPNAIHDHWLAVCAATAGRIALVDRPVQDYVQHGGNVIGERESGLREVLNRVPDLRRPLVFVDDIASSYWAWRVVMSDAIVRRFTPVPQEACVRAMSKGRLSPLLIRILVTRLVRRRLSLPAAVAFLVAAARWPFLKSPWTHAGGRESEGTVVRRAT